MNLDQLVTKLGGTGFFVVVAIAAIAVLLGYTKLAVTVASPDTAARPAVVDGTHHIGSVTDGDSLRLVDVDRPIRLIGIDAPESTAVRFGREECLGDQATAYLAAIVEEGIVEIELGDDPIDRYDRLLAYVFLPDGRLVNEMMVAAGMAYAVEYRPNTRFSGQLFEAERDARLEYLGIWGECPIEEHR